ncbi:NAD(P)H-dependent oxidoreductase [Gaetbulibacter sp. M235]|uniref:NAD(P)H-dependent oxidoreductase n=1 Tax=Gaetbulibacter sp. M235 TaxID=3126510 RepID=UPI00374F12FA
MDTIEQLRWRYATKKFDKNKKLSKLKIDTLKEAFNLTAMSFGLQPISMVVVSNNKLKESLVPYAYNQKQVSDASHLLVICIQSDVNEEDVNKHFDNVKMIRNTPETILEPYRKNLIKTIQKMSVEERKIWSINQAYIALGNLMTVCAFEEIDSCPMEGFISEKYDEILNLRGMGLKSVLLLPVGYRAEDDMFASFKKVRKSLDKTIIELN